MKSTTKRDKTIVFFWIYPEVRYDSSVHVNSNGYCNDIVIIICSIRATSHHFSFWGWPCFSGFQESMDCSGSVYNVCVRVFECIVSWALGLALVVSFVSFLFIAIAKAHAYLLFRLTIAHVKNNHRYNMNVVIPPHIIMMRAKYDP
jgi:hypothetical protein